MTKVIELTALRSQRLLNLASHGRRDAQFTFGKSKSLGAKGDILWTIEFGKSSVNHDREKRGQHVGLTTTDVEGVSAQFDESSEIDFFVGKAVKRRSNHEGKLVRKHERHVLLSFVAGLGLEVAQEMPEVDVKENSTIGQHHVVVVSIANP